MLSFNSFSLRSGWFLSISVPLSFIHSDTPTSRCNYHWRYGVQMIFSLLKLGERLTLIDSLTVKYIHQPENYGYFMCIKPLGI